jgi:hypothetical protein
MHEPRVSKAFRHSHLRFNSAHLLIAKTRAISAGIGDRRVNGPKVEQLQTLPQQTEIGEDAVAPEF